MSDLSIEANLREVRASRSASLPQLIPGLVIGVVLSAVASNYGPGLAVGTNGPLSSLLAVVLALSLMLSIVHLVLFQRAKEREIKSRLMLIESALLDMRLSNAMPDTEWSGDRH